MTVEEGQPLTFTASFDTVPAFDPGDSRRSRCSGRRAAVDDEAVDQALQRLRERAARFEPVEGRGVDDGDTRDAGPRAARQPSGEPDTTRTSAVELGAQANPPGFDEQLLGLEAGATKSFTIHYPADYAIAELAGTDVSYTRHGEGAASGGCCRSSTTSSPRTSASSRRSTRCATRVREDLEHEARHAAERERARRAAEAARRARAVRHAGVAGRARDRSPPRRVRAAADGQNIDPRQAGIDWDAFRESQREAAREAVASALVLDEIARREQIDGDRRGGRAGDRALRRAHRAHAGRASGRGSRRRADCSRFRRVCAGKRPIDFVMARATIAESQVSLPSAHFAARQPA